MRITPLEILVFLIVLSTLVILLLSILRRPRSYRGKPKHKVTPTSPKDVEPPQPPRHGTPDILLAEPFHPYLSRITQLRSRANEIEVRLLPQKNDLRHFYIVTLPVIRAFLDRAETELRSSPQPNLPMVDRIISDAHTLLEQVSSAHDTVDQSPRPASRFPLFARCRAINQKE